MVIINDNWFLFSLDHYHKVPLSQSYWAQSTGDLTMKANVTGSEEERIWIIIPGTLRNTAQL